MKSNEVILGRAKKSTKIAGIVCMVLVLLLMLLITITEISENGVDELFGILVIDLTIVVGLVVLIILLKKMPDDMIVYNNASGEFKIRQGQSMAQTKTPVCFNIDDIEEVTFREGSKKYYIVITVTKHEYIRFKLNNGQEYYVFNVETADSVFRKLYYMVNERKEENE